jgi:hypothetical protein
MSSLAGYYSGQIFTGIVSRLHNYVMYFPITIYEFHSFLNSFADSLQVHIRYYLSLFTALLLHSPSNLLFTNRAII